MFSAFFLFAFAAQVSVTSFKIGKEEIKFYENKQLRLTTTLNCEELKTDRLCPELEYLNTIQVTLDKSKVRGAPSFGSIACTEKLKGAVYLGFDKSENETSFCKIGNYFIDIGTLSYYVERNKGILKQNVKRNRN